MSGHGEPEGDVLAELASLRRRLDSVEAVVAIAALKAKYGELVDRRFVRGEVVDEASLRTLAGAIAALFTEDAEWDGGPALGVAVGRDEIAARMAAPTLSFSRHLFVCPRISVDGASATGRWDLFAPCTTGDGSSYWMCGVEDDEYVRGRDGCWLHRRMALTTVFMAPTSEGFGRIWS
ncbi:MAG TPA: nuclear transport factor 2 family protein [Acidimicrobiales bacterium]|nr:nuclear transport factor 2 family protein [Acidimicrobiales bacterium]